MTEAEWLAATNPQPMLLFLHGKASARKLRLFACACCRRVWHLLTDERGRWAVERAERYADGLAAGGELGMARLVVQDGPPARPVSQSAERRAFHAVLAVVGSRASGRAARAAAQAAGLEAGAAVQGLAGDRLREAWRRYLGVAPPEQVPAAWQAMALPAWRAVAGEERLARAARSAAEAAERRAQCDLLRDLFGNPFRPVTIDPAWLAWHGGTIPRLARAAYEERVLPAGTLDGARLAVLADALEEAGCDHAEILSHLRGPGPHVRGCWLIDLLLGKG